MDSSAQPARQASTRHSLWGSGLAEAILAYTAWGFVPVFFKLLQKAPPFEIVAHRVLWSIPLLLVMLAAMRRLAELRAAFTSPRILLALFASAALIAANWLVYIGAINGGHILAAALGYYLNPLVNVLLGVAVLKERLTRMQIAAVAVAALGVSLLLAGALDTLWISLTLAISFGLYGLIRKLTPVGAVPGLTVETLLLAPLALGAAIWFHEAGPGGGWGSGTGMNLLLMVSGAVTAIPLILFAGAARKMSYAALGFIQYLAPTIGFILGVFVYDEPMKPAQIACFVLIWISIGIFSLDMWRRSRAAG